MVKTLPSNYKRNIDILRENIKRGMTAKQALQVIESWRAQFVAHELYGEAEKQFINEALAVVEPITHITVMEV